MEQPERKAMRLPRWDYSAPGAYFITICTRERKNLFRDIHTAPDEAVGADIIRPQTAPDEAVGADIIRPQNGTGFPFPLTPAGRIVEQAICNIPEFYPAVSVDKYVIMPNHIHMILRIDTDADGRLIAAPTV